MNMTVVLNLSPKTSLFQSQPNFVAYRYVKKIINHNILLSKKEEDVFAAFNEINE